MKSRQFLNFRYTPVHFFEFHNGFLQISTKIIGLVIIGLDNNNKIVELCGMLILRRYYFR